MLVSLAGPLLNYLLAFLSLLVFGLSGLYGHGFGEWFSYLALINIGLGTFNLIPFPPLDGSHVLEELVPAARQLFERLGRFAMPLLFLCLYTGVLRRPLEYVNEAVLNGMWRLVVKVL